MIRIVSGEDVNHVLNSQKRVYYSGKNLQNDGINYIDNDGLEIAITDYKEFTGDLPHVHEWNNEYNLIIEGEIKVYLLDTHEEYSFKKHDMYLIEPGTKYMAKAKEGTIVVVVKSPGGNDKKLLSYGSEQEERWNSRWEV